jgi:DNA-binding response OmpR family regulator
MRVPVELTVLGELGDRRVSMCSENISMDGMFLFSREFVHPRAVFSAHIWLSNEEEPIEAYLTTCFIERTWTGYGIGAHISGISAEDGAVWENFYRCCASSRSEQLRHQVQSERTARSRRIVVVDGAISPLAVQALRKQGLDVASAPSTSESIALAEREPVDAIISDMQSPHMNGLSLCHEVNNRRLPTRTVLLTDGAGPREFLLGLYAGATRVIAKPCSNDLLVARILEVLQQRLPGGRVAPSAPAMDEPEVRVSPLAAAQVAEHVLSPAHSAPRHAFGRLGQAVRFVCSHLARLSAG